MAKSMVHFLLVAVLSLVILTIYDKKQQAKDKLGQAQKRVVDANRSNAPQSGLEQEHKTAVETELLLKHNQSESTALQADSSAPISVSTQPTTPRFTASEARRFAVELYAKISREHSMLMQAFQQQNTAVLYQYVMVDWPNYVNRPHPWRLVHSQGVGADYFPQSEQMQRYQVCHQAFQQLNHYAATMLQQLRASSTRSQLSLNQQQQLFITHKALCQNAIELPIAQT